MIKTVRFAAVLLLTIAAGCGPIIGQSMMSSIGVKDFQVRGGALTDFKASKHVLVYAPFAKGEKGYHICRGEDEANLSTGLQKEGVFQTAFFFERNLDREEATLAALRSKTPAEIEKELNLPWAPDAILSGTILEREDNVAPAAGIIQTLRLRLDLYNLEAKRSSTIEIAVKELHQKTMTFICQEIKRRLSGP